MLVLVGMGEQGRGAAGVDADTAGAGREPMGPAPLRRVVVVDRGGQEFLPAFFSPIPVKFGSG